MKFGKLSNGMRYIIDKNGSRYSANILFMVRVGSRHEVKGKYGLAHFLEHMLFLGSKKYPGENQFEELLNENGGHSNAYTDTFETVYYFSIFNNKLEKAIDMFSRFFIDPLFDEDSVNREINAIQSEHDKNIQQDMWRNYHLFGLISKKGSMINKFGTGNLDSLKKNGVRDNMIKFYNKYYVSSNINIVTVSSVDNNVVKGYIEKSFSNISKRFEPKITIEKPFFEKTGKNYFLKSISKEHNLIYLWEIPDHINNYLNTHSPHIIRDVISSDNTNSLKRQLVNKGIIKHLYSSVMDEGLFILKISLPELSYWNEVDSYVRYYINDLINNDWFKIAQYYKKKDELLFNFSSKDDSNDLGLKLVTNLIYYPLERTYIGPNVIDKIDIEQIKTLLNDYLTFDKVNMILTSDINPNSLGDNIKSGITETEPYYGLEYNKLILKLNEIKKLKYDIITENPFLDTSPKWVKGLDKNLIPMKLSSSLSSKIWFGNVSKFKETKIYSQLIFTNSEFIFDIDNYVNTLILLRYINKKIQEDFNLASEIGFDAHLSIDTYDSVVTIDIYGHNDNFQNYFNLITQYIKDFTYKDEDKTMLEVIINATKDNYMNIKKHNPWEYSPYLEELNINKFSYTIEQVVNYIKSLDITNFSRRISETKNRILFQSKFTTFIYGNVEYSTLFESGNNLNIIFPSIEKPSNILKQLVDIDCKHPNKDEKDNFVQFTYEIGRFNPIDNLLLLILTISIGQDFFDNLRTKQQFGYLVGSRQVRYQEIYYFKQKIQSSRSIKDIDSAIQKFNTNFLSQITEDKYNKYVDTAKKMLEERVNNTRELFYKYLDEIRRNKFTFDRRKLVLNKIKNISYEKFKQFYTDKILKGHLTKMYIRSQK